MGTWTLRTVPSPNWSDMNEDVREQFGLLKTRLIEMYRRVFPDPLARQTIVVVPSLTLDPDELARIDGAHHYEERMLFLLMLLQMPQTQLVYVTSQPVSPSVIDYFLHLLPGIPSTHARRRLTLLSCYDASPLPLVQKILDRPRMIEKIREAIKHPDTAHMSCFNSTTLEAELAVRLRIPLYATDPDHAHLGSKSGSRSIFREAGIAMPDGYEDLRSKQDIVLALAEIKRRNPHLPKAVIKLNEGFSGEGNAIFPLSECPLENAAQWIEAALPNLVQFEAQGESWDHYSTKFQEMEGIVEAFVVGEDKRSPSVQCRINPSGKWKLCPLTIRF